MDCPPLLASTFGFGFLASSMIAAKFGIGCST